MRLGIDFGTTRIVVAAVDRGNYPLAGFEAGDGSVRDWLPALVAYTPQGRTYGWEAWSRQGEESCLVVRSLKRVLAVAGPASTLRLGDEPVALATLLREMTAHLRDQIRQNSSLRVKPQDKLEIMLGVPANANSNQRFLTVEAFRAAGFEVLGLLNEPSAASIEYAHRNDVPRDEKILVYDLGGGTFDVSLVECNARQHAVLATGGIPTLGGDDFDAVLADMALEAAGVAPESLPTAEEFLLAEECRQKKESLHPNTRRMALDLDNVRAGLGTVSLAVSAYYERCQPLLDETIQATEGLLNRCEDPGSVSFYVTGGGSELPLVGRALRERFGRRVKRSSYTRSATAIGLAIQADEAAGYRLRERFTRFFGVWREADAGQRVVFDALFERDTPLPGPGEPPLTRTRQYAPVHNLGHFRYLECSHRTASGEPAGDLMSWDEIRFPFDPALESLPDWSTATVEWSARAAGQMVEERYFADASGGVEVEIANLTSGFSRRFRLGRWSPEAVTLPAPGTRARKARA
jgi:molecular chaperone DnaK (HSP70)